MEYRTGGVRVNGRMRNLGIDQGMLGLISKYWWVMLLRGVFAIVFGIIAIVWPGLTLLR